jgi:membrane protein DedA with SNARE-associated domain
LSDALLTSVLVYGPPILGLVLLVGALGIPIPGTMLLLAAGAFVRQGVLSPAPAAALALLGVVLGDCGGYLLGRMAGTRLAQRFGSGATWLRAEATFRRWGGIAIVLTRFFLTPLAVPTNLIAGASAYPAGRFLFLDVSGELVWVLSYGALGYLFASSWETLNALIGNLTGILVGVLGLAFAAMLAYRFRRGTPGRPGPASEAHPAITS